MSNTSEGIFSCRNVCWIVGALVGLVVALLIKGIWGLLVGIAVAIALALVLKRLFCSEYEDTRGTGSGATRASTAPSATSAAAPAATPAATPARSATAEARAPERDVEQPAEAGESTEAEPAREAEAAAAAREAAAAEAAEAAAQAEADAQAEAALAEVAEPANKDYDGDGVLEGEAEGTRPEALAGPRGGKADDLKLIKGIGPKLEQLCNELGFYHYDQIANWTPDEVAWVNANLKGFKGRVTRDNWVEQARVLAAGGTTEFAKRAEKSGLYDKNKN